LFRTSTEGNLLAMPEIFTAVGLVATALLALTRWLEERG
jgi:hypothetical protein